LDEIGCDPPRIDHGFIRCHVEVQVLFTDAPEGAQIGPEGRAGPFASIAVDLASAIPIIIPCPSWVRWPTVSVGGVAAVIALHSSVYSMVAAGRDVLREQVVAGLFRRVVADPEALLARVPRDDTDDGRTVVRVRPMPLRLLARRRADPQGQDVACFFPRVLVQLSASKAVPGMTSVGAVLFRLAWMRCRRYEAVCVTASTRVPGGPWARPSQSRAATAPG